MREGLRDRRRLAAAGLAAAAAIGGALGAAVPEGRPAAAQIGRRPAPDIWHWVLPAQHDGVEVVDLHPGDCYVIRQVDGLVHFGEPPAGVLELQGRLGEPVAHLVEEVGDHPECRRDTCAEVSRLTAEIASRLVAGGDRRTLRRADHRPAPLDDMRGGAYSDVGSPDRPRYRRTPEQRMAYLHLRTAGRDNCYAAQAPRTLTVHVRDRQHRDDRTGFYSGYVYVEHQHAPVPGRAADRGPTARPGAQSNGHDRGRAVSPGRAAAPDRAARPGPANRHGRGRAGARHPETGVPGPVRTPRRPGHFTATPPGTRAALRAAAPLWRRTLPARFVEANDR